MKTNDKKDRLITIGEVSNLLGVCQDTLRDWDKTKRLVSIRTAGGHRRYLLSDILKIQQAGF